MIIEFIDSWDLFADTYLAGWLIAWVLSMVGVVVVGRDQVFIGAAVAQASTLGIAIQIALGGYLLIEGSTLLTEENLGAAMSVLFAVIASVLIDWRSGSGRETHESITGWVFLACAALSVLVVTDSPHGLEEVHRLLASSIIGATRADVGIFLALGLVGTLTVAFKRRTILLMVMDREAGAVLGVRVGWWGAGMAIWLGVCLGLSLRTAGMLYAFGCLILPALIAKNVCRNVGPMFVVAPAIGIGSCVAAFVIANHYDWPPAQTSVSLMGLLLLPAWGVRGLKRG